MPILEVEEKAGRIDHCALLKSILTMFGVGQRKITPPNIPKTGHLMRITDTETSEFNLRICEFPSVAGQLFMTNLDVIRQNLIGSLRRCEDEMELPSSLMTPSERILVQWLRDNDISPNDVLRVASHLQQAGDSRKDQS